MCKYCDSEKEVINLDTYEYSGIEITLIKNLIRVRTYENNKTSTFNSQDGVIIKYCPFCGKKLKEI